MNIDLQFVDNSLSTFVYEPFSFTISNIGSYTLTTSTTSGIPPGYLANYNTEVIFSATSNAMGVGSESFTITAKDASGTTVATSSNIVTVGAGRFLDAVGGNSYLGSNFAFYKNEPITPITLVAPFAISVPTSVPTLPPGLAYTSNDSNTYTISGTPLVTVPQSNYLVIGKGSGSNLGKIVTSQFGLSVSNERILMNLEGAPIVSQMTVGTPIPPRTITSAFPPYPYGGTLRYTWSGVPDGISVTDSGGVPQSSPFTPLDLSSTLIIQGAPSLAAANAYRNADIESNVVTFMATRTNPLPQISNSIPITFGFGETVLFDSVTVPTLYSGVALNSTAISFHAQTYFGSGSAIANISATSLPPGLSLNFVGDGRAYLIGTPTTVGSASYTITAVNSTSPTPVSRDLIVPITVTTDTVTFVSPTPNPADAPSNFVLSRPISSALPGYYTSNIQFKATAASGNAVTFSTSSFAGTGLSLSSAGSNTVQLVGTPESVTSLTTATITASVVGTPATASTTFKFEILDDEITFSQPSALQLSFIQNRAITPIQLSATTLSERPVISFTSSNMPSGLSISSTGIISGTPLSSSVTPFDVTGSTGYMSDSEPYTYTLTPDSLLLIEEPPPSYALTLGGAIPAATVVGLTYSGLAASNYVFVDVSASTYGITIGNTTGVFGGTLTTSLPPALILPSNVTFSVQATAGALTASLPVELNTSNAPQYEWFVLKSASIGTTRTTLDNWSRLKLASETIYIPSYTDYSIRPITVDTRTIVAVSERTGVSYSSNGTTFIDYEIPGIPWPFTSPSAGFGPQTGFLNMGPKFITRVGNTTTLYGTSYDWQFTNIGAFWKSLDDGLTWTGDFPLLATGITGLTYEPNAVRFGNAIAYKNSTLLIAGQNNTDPAVIRSVNGGDTWAAVTGSAGWWGSAFCTDAARWILAGSSYYASNTPWGGATDVRTLLYSDDDGAVWSNVTTGDFNYIADFVVYGNGTWIAAGREGVGDTLSYAQFRSSTDGLTWTSFTINDVTIWPSFPVYYEPPDDEYRATFLDSILFDGESFIILLRYANGTDPEYLTSIPSAYIHPADGTSLSSGWTAVEMTTLAAFGDPAAPSLFLKGRYPIALEAPTPVLYFPSQVGNGPTVTSPSNTSLVLYQYAPITPITFSATGTGTVYFFLRDADLPRGLTFNSVTNTLSGTPMLLGSTSVTVYVKDDDGVTLLTLQIRVLVPSIDRRQTSAGAWTSLIRQYTVVNAAQNSSNGKTLPATEPPLGEFMRPPPPDSVNVLPCPKC